MGASTVKKCYTSERGRGWMREHRGLYVPVVEWADRTDLGGVVAHTTALEAHHCWVSCRKAGNRCTGTCFLGTREPESACELWRKMGWGRFATGKKATTIMVV